MPVYRSHLIDAQDLGLGRRVREMRHRQGLTLNDLSARADLSIGTLSQIENELRPPGLKQLFAIARGLGVSAESVLPEELSFPYQLTREADLWDREAQTPQVLKSDPGGPYPHLLWPLADRFVGRHLEPFLGRILPLPDGRIRHHYHHEDEFLFVLRGSIELQIDARDGLRIEILERGDCVYLGAGIPHSVRSAGSQPAESIHVTPATSTAPAASSSRPLANSGGWVAERSSDPLHVLGKELSILRAAHGWSLKEAARMAGLKPTELQRIENGRKAVSLHLMMQLARVYGKPLRSLLRCTRQERPDLCVTRASDVQRTVPRTRRTPVDTRSNKPSQIFYPLARKFPTREMYPYLVKLLNVEVGSLTPHEHNGEEFFFVLDGELELTTYAGERRITERLQPGDFCYLDSSVPHLLRSETRNPYSRTSAEVIVVFWCPLGESYLFGEMNPAGLRQAADASRDHGPRPRPKQ